MSGLTADGVRAAAGRAAPRVAARLREMDQEFDGNCLYAALVGTAELAREGLPALMQAGAAFWLRSDRPEESETGMFGYAYDPDSGLSRHVMAGGGLMEFHAWSAVPFLHERGPAERTYGGCVVDFAAHQFPRRARGVHGRPEAWDRPEPPDPCVIGVDDPRMGRAFVYESGVEPCRLIGLCARVLLCRLIRAGFPAAGLVDLWAVAGGPPSPRVPGRDIDYAEGASAAALLQSVRLIEERRTGKPVRPGSTALGVW